jgi:hypothetical protein
MLVEVVELQVFKESAGPAFLCRHPDLISELVSASLPCRQLRAYPSSTADAAHTNEVVVRAPCATLRFWSLTALSEREEEAGDDEQRRGEHHQPGCVGSSHTRSTPLPQIMPNRSV